MEFQLLGSKLFHFKSTRDISLVQGQEGSEEPCSK